MIEKIIHALIEEEERYKRELLNVKVVKDYTDYKHMTGMILGLAKARQVIDMVLQKEADSEY